MTVTYLSVKGASRLAALLLKYRLAARLTQVEVERLTGVGEKTLSTFETGMRAGAISFAQLVTLLDVYEVTLSQLDKDLLRMVARAGSISN